MKTFTLLLIANPKDRLIKPKHWIIIGSFMFMLKESHFKNRKCEY